MISPTIVNKEIMLLLVKNFDFLSWWKEFELMFPYVFPSAIIWISKPATNAFHERGFPMSS